MKTMAEVLRDEGREQGLKQGLEQGRKEVLVRVLRKLVVQRFGDVGPTLEARIAGASHGDLERAIERILTATSAADVLG